MKQLYRTTLFLLMTLVVFSCRKDEIKYEEDIVIIQTNEDGEVGLQGHITDTSKNSVAGAKVAVGDQTVFTDDYGFFFIENANVVNGNVALSVEKSNFITQYKKLPIVEGMDESFVNASLLSSQNTNQSFPSDQSTVVVGNGGHTVTFLANSIVNENGSDYNGEVIFSSYYIDPTRSDLTAIMPGDLSAINLQGEEVQLVSYGMLYGDLTSPTGAPLQIREGSTATIELLIQSSQLGSAPDQIPLWSLDEQSATWLEEGVAIKEGDKYVAKVSHFSFWNCDVPFPVVEVTGYAYDQDGLPLPNADLFVTVLDMGVTRYATTDGNGYFYGKFPKDEDMIIGINNDCGEDSQNTFGPFAETANAGDFSFDISQVGFVIKGVLRNCELLPIYPGFIEVTHSNGQIALFPTAEDGSFLTSYINCGQSDISVRGVDLITPSVGQDTSYSLTEGSNDLGDIFSCSQQLDEYFIISVNGEQQIFTNVTANRFVNKLFIFASNTQFDLVFELEEDDISAPLKKIIINDITIVVVDNDDFTFSFSNSDPIGVGQEVSGLFSGFVSFGSYTLDGNYKLIVDNELTPISGVVWDDINQNGIREIGEPPIQNVQINTDNQSHGIKNRVLTDEFGAYTTYGTHLSVNTLSVGFLPSGFSLTNQGVGLNMEIDSDFSQNNGVAEVTISGPGQEVFNIDAGIYQ